MIAAVRKSQDRGRFQIDWLDSRHTFSFGDYFDPKHMGFRSLRVINEDVIAPGGGFPPHPHRDMEIVTYLISGALEHRDSSGGGSIIRQGQAQHMSAGTGITHSEFNPSQTEPCRLLQIWIAPDAQGHPPGYREIEAGAALEPGVPRLIASPDGRDGSLLIHQDATINALKLEKGAGLALPAKPERGYWIQVVGGEIDINKVKLAQGDGLALKSASSMDIAAIGDAELILFDLP